MKKVISLLAVLVFLAGCGGGGQDPVDNGGGPVVIVKEPEVKVTFVSTANPASTGLKISRRIMAGLPKELEGQIKYLYVHYDHAGYRHGSTMYEFSDNAGVGDEVQVPLLTTVVSVSLLSINETEVAQGILIMSFEANWINKKIPDVPIDINLNRWIGSDLAFFNLPGTWSMLTSGGQTKWYRVKFAADNHIGDSYKNVMDFCNFITLGGKMALLLENVWLPYFEPNCLELNCPGLTARPTIEITLTDDTGREWKFNFGINSFIPFLEDTPVALYYK